MMTHAIAACKQSVNQHIVGTSFSHDCEGTTGEGGGACVGEQGGEGQPLTSSRVEVVVDVECMEVDSVEEVEGTRLRLRKA